MRHRGGAVDIGQGGRPPQPCAAAGSRRLPLEKAGEGPRLRGAALLPFFHFGGEEQASGGGSPEERDAAGEVAALVQQRLPRHIVFLGGQTEGRKRRAPGFFRGGLPGAFRLAVLFSAGADGEEEHICVRRRRARARFGGGSHPHYVRLRRPDLLRLLLVRLRRGGGAGRACGLGGRVGRRLGAGEKTGRIRAAGGRRHARGWQPPGSRPRRANSPPRRAAPESALARAGSLFPSPPSPASHPPAPAGPALVPCQCGPAGPPASPAAPQPRPRRPPLPLLFARRW